MKPRGSSGNLSVFAPAKVNLYLHVTGRRDDGYHLLDSLVAFADIGDRLTLTPANDFSFSVQGPFANAFTAKERDASPNSANLVVRAVWALSQAVQRPPHVRVTLTKNLPLASGLGGGSVDAAATLWALLEWWGLPLQAVPQLPDLMNELGADVPACFSCQPQWVGGAGEKLKPLKNLPEAPVVLANPGRHCRTAEVFSAFDGKFHAQGEKPVFDDFDGLLEFLGRQDNMLTRPALQLVPEIGAARDLLALQPGCRLARMSGSGATCFGLFETEEAATGAAENILAHNPQWWVRAGTLNRPERY